MSKKANLPKKKNAVDPSPQSAHGRMRRPGIGHWKGPAASIRLFVAATNDGCPVSALVLTLTSFLVHRAQSGPPPLRNLWK